jgi:glutamate formiminotransferase/formiminotetrahydrofolate cyclodeaminase
MPDSWSGNWGDVEERFGAVAVGVRPVLVAYNVNVDEPTPVASKAAGSLVRTSGRLIKNATGEKVRARGMLDAVQGMGVPLPSHNICQVSMNLQNHAITPMHVAFECVKSICSDHGVELCGSELVGLVPLEAMLDSGHWYSSETEADDQILVQAAIEGLGLDYLAEFDPQTRIIEWAITNQLGD